MYIHVYVYNVHIHNISLYIYIYIYICTHTCLSPLRCTSSVLSGDDSWGGLTIISTAYISDVRSKQATTTCFNYTRHRLFV